MKRSNFDDILNECIERMLRGDSIEACLAAHPEQAAELEPLLRTAGDTIKAAAITPRPEFRQRAGYEFQAAIRNLRPEKYNLFRWPARWLVTVSSVIVVLLAGTGTVAASTNSLPDQPLYAVKLATENIRLTMTFSAVGKAELYAEFADRRVDEIIKMAEQGKVAQVERATDRMDDQLNAMASLFLPSGTAGTAEKETPPALMATPQAVPAPTATGPSLKNVPGPALSAPGNGGPSLSTANITPTRDQALAPPSTEAEETEQTRGRPDLGTTVSEQAAENTRKLEEALKEVPDSTRPALERALDVADKGYNEALENIERK
jgi:hypothetical protein